MANSMRNEARASADDKMRRMGVKATTADFDNTEEYGAPDRDSTPGVAPVGYADDFRDGDRAASRVGKTSGPIEGKKTKARLDRPAYARGGSVKGKGTSVNIVIAPQGSSPPPAGMPVPPAAGAPPLPLPPGVPAGGPAAPPMPMRKRGGRVAYEAGAGSGDGRLEKIRNYGAKARAK
jgi:hypothetical protein